MNFVAVPTALREDPTISNLENSSHLGVAVVGNEELASRDLAVFATAMA
jgi:hypothetical protein